MSKHEINTWYAKCDLATEVYRLAVACHDRIRATRALNKLMAIDEYLYSMGIRG